MNTALAANLYNQHYALFLNTVQILLVKETVSYYTNESNLYKLWVAEAKESHLLKN